MNKKITIILIIIFVFGIVGYITMKKPPQSTIKQAPVAQNNIADKKQTIQGTLKSLFTSGKSQKCTYSNKLESASVQGSVYVANGKMRGDFTTITKEAKMNGHMIVDGGYSYVWSDSSNQGIKMAFNQEQLTPSKAPAGSNNQAVDLNQMYSYSCSGWTQDSAIFAPPTNITFSTFALPSMQPSDAAASLNEETNTSVCSACNSIPEGAARDACKSQLNCK